jgi:PhzF family phenazine biosynthesis protein
MKIPIYQVDAFTDRLFGGNPAAVCPLDSWPADELMQKIAAENNLSETAFFVKEKNGYGLRWFTPLMEVDLCGHATLATGHVIFHVLGYKDQEVKFSTKSGQLIVAREDDMLRLDFPANPARPVETPPRLVDGLGKEPERVLKSKRDFLVVYPHEEDILALKPNFDILKKLECLCVIVTAAGKSCDFVSRCFAPIAGINEDPVTGSAHTTLVPYWACKLDKASLHAMQLSNRRGELFCEYLGEWVQIKGRAVLYLKGEIDV